MKPAQQAFIAVAVVLGMIGLLDLDGLTLGAVLGVVLYFVSQPIIRLFDPGDRMRLKEIFALAVTLRWLCAAFVHLVIYRTQPGLFGPDEIYYDIAGKYLAEYLAGHVPDPFRDQWAGGITWVIGVSYYLFGYSPLIPKMLNGLVGGWTAVVCGLIAAKIFNEAVARRAAFIAAIAPSLVLFASVNAKDTSTLLGSEVALLAYIHLRQRITLRSVVFFIGGLLLIAANRTYEVTFIGAGVAASLFFGERRNVLRNAMIAAAMAGAVAYFAVRTGGTDIIDSGEQGRVAEVAVLREAFATGAGSAVDISLVDTSTPLGLAAWTPIGLFYFFFAPIPFTGTSTISIATTPEMLVWYYLLPSLVRGLVLALRRRTAMVMPLFVYLLTSSIGWAVIVTNVGTLYRYRAQVLFLLIICIAADQIRRQMESQQMLVPARPEPRPSPPRAIAVRSG